ncbi:MAG: ABC transporter permease [Acidimicrobiales bacterium]
MSAADLRRVGAIARKELITLTSYRIAMMTRFLTVWYFAISFYFIADFVGTPDAIADVEGGYFGFVLVGAVVTSFATAGVSAFPAQIAEEQDEGTLEAVLSTPTPLWTMVAGGFVVPMVFVLAETGVLVAVGLGLLGDGVPVLGLTRALPFLMLTTASFAALGIAAAAFLVLVKRGDPFSGPVRQLTLLLSGALYPTATLPGWVELLSRLVPATYGVRATRALVGGASYRETLDEAVVLAGFTAVALPLAVWLFRRAITVARRSGTLGTY